MPRYLIIIGLAAAVAWYFRDTEVRHPPGILVSQAPLQKNINAGQRIQMEDFILTQRAEFSVHARVLSAERYFVGTEADLSPLDLALGWGPMSDQDVLDQIDISQGGRWYRTRYELPPPLPDDQIIFHSSNMHMIPANGSVARSLKKLGRGDLIRIEGYLVDVDRNDGWRWRTSMRRNDTGAGACEIVFVERVENET